MLRLREQSCALLWHLPGVWPFPGASVLLCRFLSVLVSALITPYYLVQYLSVRNWGPDLATSGWQKDDEKREVEKRGKEEIEDSGQTQTLPWTLITEVIKCESVSFFAK